MNNWSLTKGMVVCSESGKTQLPASRAATSVAQHCEGTMHIIETRLEVNGKRVGGYLCQASTHIHMHTQVHGQDKNIMPPAALRMSGKGIKTTNVHHCTTLSGHTVNMILK